MAVFFNQATLSYNGGVANSNIVSGEIVEVITATKTATPSTYRQGDTVTYAVNLLNSGTAAVSGLTISDDLGAFTPTVGGQTVVPLNYVADSVRYFVNGTPVAAPTVTSGTTLDISGITVPAGGNVTILYQATVNDLAPLATGNTVVNTATVSGGGLVNAVTTDETITANDAAALGITKSVSPQTVSENGQLTYTFVIENRGNTEADAADNLSVTDTFDPILSDLTVTLDGQTVAENTDYTYNQATGEFATVQGRITVPAATYTTSPTGQVTIVPGSAILTVTGTV